VTFSVNAFAANAVALACICAWEDALEDASSTSVTEINAESKRQKCPSKIKDSEMDVLGEEKCVLDSENDNYFWIKFEYYKVKYFWIA